MSFFGWIIAILLGSLFAGAVYVVGNWKTIIGKSICVLGLPQTGKTLFYTALRGDYASSEPQQTSVDNIKSFMLKNERGKAVLKIRDTIDIGGSDAFVEGYYEDLIKGSDVVIFCCNVYEYLNVSSKSRDVRTRLMYIYTLMKRYGKINDEAPGDNIRILLTYADKVDDRKEATIAFLESLEDEQYPKKFVSNIMAINMTDQDEVKELIKKMLYEE